MNNQPYIEGPSYPDLFDGLTPIMIEAEAVCIGCGCTDTSACIEIGSSDTCHWVEVNYDAALGACSNCEEWANIIRRIEPVTSDKHVKCKKCKTSKQFMEINTPNDLIHLLICPNCHNL
tara:strand:+ start:1480 stop:1836 length:357 start_codon:yes stop_codon:yes gene_type:complete